MATAEERAELSRRLRVLGGSALAAQARVAGYHVDLDRVEAAVANLLAGIDL